MELIRGSSNLRERHEGSVVTIGTFDGLHLGHQVLLRRLKEHAFRLARPAMMLTFEPMPREYLVPARPPARLTSWRERWHILGERGLDYMCVLRFGEGLRSLSGDGFAELLARRLHSHLVLVGHDFRFGRNGEATAGMLAEAGKALGFEVDVVPPVLLEGVRVSSSGVREALASSQFELARKWLGRPYSMTGRVVRGNQLGRELGFPTANVALPASIAVPADGVYAGWYLRPDGAHRPAALSLGRRPTFYEQAELSLLEAYLLDFDGDLYGEAARVEFVAHLRGQVRFETVDDLIVQMNRDVALTREILGVADLA